METTISASLKMANDMVLGNISFIVGRRKMGSGGMISFKNEKIKVEK